MKTILVLLFSCLTLGVVAQDGGKKKKDHEPRVYIMMKKGQLLEVDSGQRSKVISEKTLTNGTTIHRDGTINESNGKTRKLREGEYITMDGKIRWLSDMDATGKP
ncbi:MAG: hypothetical protein JST42_12010 [Bacteroidetes bacterium]|nr:hypothetical protein [Bacteroidota bacterium]